MHASRAEHTGRSAAALPSAPHRRIRRNSPATRSRGHALPLGSARCLWVALNPRCAGRSSPLQAVGATGRALRLRLGPWQRSQQPRLVCCQCERMPVSLAANGCVARSLRRLCAPPAALAPFTRARQCQLPSHRRLGATPAPPTPGNSRLRPTPQELASPPPPRRSLLCLAQKSAARSPEPVLAGATTGSRGTPCPPAR